MLKLVEIFKSWVASANPTEEQRLIAEYRTSVCDKCIYKEYRKNIQMYVCGECGCPLQAKVFSPLPGVQACPKQLWEK